MNCDAKNCNVIVNAPRTLICISVSSRVDLLTHLHRDGLLTPATPAPRDEEIP
jgi:hypothetical protein